MCHVEKYPILEKYGENCETKTLKKSEKQRGRHNTRQQQPHNIQTLQLGDWICLVGQFSVNKPAAQAAGADLSQ